MKSKIFLILAAIILTFSILLAGCTENGGETDSDVESASESESESVSGSENESEEESESESGNDNSESDTKKESKLVKESYLPEALSAEVAQRFAEELELFKPFSLSNAPFAFQDVYTVSNCKITSITVPVYSTGAADANGDLILTVCEASNSYDNIKTSVNKTHTIKINAAEYGLTENTEGIGKLIKIDVSDMNIDLSKYETLAFGAETDTIIPAYVANAVKDINPLSTSYRTQFPQATGAFEKVGSAFSIIHHTLCFDLEWEREYKSEEAYQEILDAEQEYKDMVAALRERYQGKTLSVLGDSISTYQYVSDNGYDNATIINNVPYYPNADQNVYDYTYTYWGRLMKDLGMELCVNNSWSSSRVYGRENQNDSMPLRATELDNDNGTYDDTSDDIAPDVILVYMGINDLQNDSPFGSLYNLLVEDNGKTDAEKIDEWLEKVLAVADATEGTVRGTSYTSFEAAYALGLHYMKEKYPNAEIYCMTLIQTRDSARCSADQIGEYNTVIKALGEYFGATVINQLSSDAERTFLNSHAYTSDGHCIHPDSRGHELIERLIVKTMYKSKENG